MSVEDSRRIFTTGDARELARRRLPRLVFDFVDGAAGSELAVEKNASTMEGIELQPRVLENVSERQLNTSFLGSEYGLPVGIAPMGMCNLIWPGADRMLAKAAVDFDIPLCLSSAASSSIEDMKRWAGGNAWFQLYAGQSVDHVMAMVERAGTAGYDTLILTADVPEVSRRVRDLRNGFRVPFRIGPHQCLDFALHPRWSLSTLLHGAPRPANFPARSGQGEFDRGASRAGADWAFLDRLRKMWPGTLIVKGVTSADDALRIRGAGVDGIYVSNHGGRQLDSAPPAIDVLPKIRAALGADYPLIFDSGVRCGEDVVKALALGADFVMLGRPLLYAIGAEGERGLRSLLRIIARDISLTLAQIGLCRVEEVTENVLVHRPVTPHGAILSGPEKRLRVTDDREKSVREA